MLHRAEVAEAKWSEAEKQYEDSAAQLLVVKRSLHILQEQMAQLKDGEPAPKKEEPKPDSNGKPKGGDDIQPQITELTAELVQVRAEAEIRSQQIEELNAQLSSCQSELNEQKMSDHEVSEEEVNTPRDDSE